MKSIFILLLFLTVNIFALEKVSLALEWKYQFQFAGYIAAKEKGFYKEAGFDVELIEYNNKNTIDMLFDKEATFATAKSRVILDKMQGKEIVLLASFFKKSALVFVAQEDIHSPEQFINVSIMSTPGELTHSNLAILLNKFNITLNDFEFIEQTFNIQNFIDKKVDVMSAFVSNELYQLDKLQYKYNIIDPANYGIYTYNENLVTSLDYVKKNPARVQAFKEATIKGWEYALENKRELVDIIYNQYSDRKSKKALLYEAYKTEELMIPHIFDIGSINSVIIDNIAHYYIEMGLTSKHYNLDNFIFNNNKVVRTKNLTIKLSEEEKKYLKEKQIKMCIDPNWMPYEAIINGKYVGIGSEYFSHVEKLLGVKLEVLHTATWNESLEKGRKRECDIFSMIVETKSRRDFLNFTNTNFSFPIVVSTLKETPFIRDIQNHKKKYTVLKSYAIINKLKEKNIDLIIVDNLSEAFKLIQSGKAYGHIDYLSSSAFFIKNNYYATMKINTKLDINQDIKIGVRNDDKILFSIFNKISHFISPEQRQKLLNKYASVKYEKKTDYSLIYKIIAIFTLLLLFVLFRYVVVSKNHKELQKLQDELNELNSSLQIKINDEIVKSLRKDKYLQEQTKLAAMGEMVGAIAHQWRQPLNSLNINIQNLDDDYDDGLINKEFIDEFIARQTTTIRFMSKTIDDFRNFFRVDKIKNDFSIKDAIQSTINIQNAQLTTHNINIEIKGEDFIINGLKSEFQQVILNLVTNAKDELVKRAIKNPNIKIRLENKTIYVLDNAGGIPEKIISRIFEPYFTTKEQGKGTGMGLYMSKMIIETNMDGKFSARNREDGAEFSIRLA